MTARLRELSLTLLLLFVLLAIEFGMAFLPLPRSLRPLILIPAALMVCVVGSVFMEVRQGPSIVRLFAIAALLWLAILLGLGSLDPLTRKDYLVQDPAAIPGPAPASAAPQTPADVP
jgi:cytochrome c oxidase subunit IV